MEEQRQKIQQLIDTFDYEKATILLNEILKVDPHNVEVLDTISEVYVNLDNTKEAMKVIKKSIELDPHNNPEKYMTLGQFSDYKTSLTCYRKGIELFMNELNTVSDDKKPNIRSSIASAYASIAELYMISDLCYEPDAEAVCENALKEGFAYNPESYDVLVQLANLRILRCRDNEALQYMDQIYNNVIILVEAGSDDLPDEDILSNLAKNYAELKLFEKAIKIYDVLVKINDQDVRIY
jgi:tetratricopeptide (TPR) repeat protein